MKRLVAILLSASLLLTVGVGSVSADTRCGGNPGVTFYDGKSYTGATRTYCGSQFPLWSFADSDMAPEGWSNKASSLQTFNFPSNGGIYFYDLKSYGANKITVTQNSDITDLSVYFKTTYIDGNGFNNRISSFKTFY